MKDFISKANRRRSCTRVTIFKIRNGLELKKRFRSHTHVATLMINRVLKTFKTKSNRDPVLRDQKMCPRGTKLTSFAKGIFQPFNLLKFCRNPVGKPSVLRI